LLILGLVTSCDDCGLTALKTGDSAIWLYLPTQDRKEADTDIEDRMDLGQFAPNSTSGIRIRDERIKATYNQQGQERCPYLDRTRVLKIRGPAEEMTREF
jgi:hypothetical protein